MQLTGKQIIKNGIIGNYADESIQQQGIDVRVATITEVFGEGLVPTQGKTNQCPTIAISPVDGVYNLAPGWYEVTLMESCKIPANAVLNYKTRSSMIRCGATVHSGQFDAGFETDAMGCFIEVRLPIQIGIGARIAQATVTESYPVDMEDLYNGQWQKDKQRAKKISKK